MKKLLLTFFLLISPSYLLAAQDYYQFTDSEQQQRFQSLTTELRCLVCQNQNIAESNAGLAVDLRNQIYQKIQKGQTNTEIVNYLVSRYGDFILYRPPMNNVTLVLWLTPFLFLMSGIIYLIYYIVSKQRVSP